MNDVMMNNHHWIDVYAFDFHSVLNYDRNEMNLFRSRIYFKSKIKKKLIEFYSIGADVFWANPDLFDLDFSIVDVYDDCDSMMVDV